MNWSLGVSASVKVVARRPSKRGGGSVRLAYRRLKTFAGKDMDGSHARAPRAHEARVRF